MSVVCKAADFQLNKSWLLFEPLLIQGLTLYFVVIQQQQQRVENCFVLIVVGTVTRFTVLLAMAGLISHVYCYRSATA